ncbi:TFIIB-type zinc ribbon-containing protein [Nocardioides donggukensis]|uniref:Zf-TFIIB domain-containing protein n=1 Tax=Nocardioides donggukensis TaxID=2774019 RepID=A0A927Q111_9ACTN|nr:zf-TFIIB domain-containing protein [Nocardioides donggukensis]MBD8869552.1 zf-TFIIB domain-containing protein [Nocardioides donggukensis]
MDALDCPRCGAEMVTRSVGTSHVNQCPEGHGVFLERAELGALADAENGWHREDGHHTAPLPRITADMVPPPPSRPRASAWVETLFS